MHYKILLTKSFEKDLDNLLKPGDVVLVKASRGMEMDRIVKEILEAGEDMQ